MAKEIACKESGLNCPFMLRTESDDELVSFTQQHAKKAHKMDISKADVLKMAKKV
jgi:predicted small metal-binding protein